MTAPTVSVVVCCHDAAATVAHTLASLRDQSFSDIEILAIDDVLDRLAQVEPRKAEVVKLRYFVGMTIEETAEALGISTPTAKRDWIYARAWLFRELKRDP